MHIAGIPLSPDVAQALNQVYLARGSLATTAIEGNTLSEKEVLQILKGELELPPSKQYLKKEVENIIHACNEISQDAIKAADTNMSSDDVRYYNRLVLDGLSLSPDVTPGEFREHSVTVGRYRGAPAQDLGFLLDKLVGILNDFPVPAGEELAYGILKALFAHLYMAWIHPFGDGNGRTARLIEFKILVDAGCPTPAVHLLSNHYNQTRSEYYRQLDAASQSGGEIMPFIEYALQGFVDQLRSTIEFIRQDQLKVHWINFIHRKFQDRETKPSIRQRHLILDLSNVEAAVPFNKIRHISARIAEEYANTSDRTLQRDLERLEELNLIKISDVGIRTNREVILAFLPERKVQESTPIDSDQLSLELE